MFYVRKTNNFKMRITSNSSTMTYKVWTRMFGTLYKQDQDILHVTFSFTRLSLSLSCTFSFTRSTLSRLVPYIPRYIFIATSIELHKERQRFHRLYLAISIQNLEHFNTTFVIRYYRMLTSLFKMILVPGEGVSGHLSSCLLQDLESREPSDVLIVK